MASWDDSLENRMKSKTLSHAYLVVGENREALAHRLAAAMMCTGDAPPCGRCAGCRKASLGIHPDIFVADPQGEGLKAEAVRSLRSDAYIRPNEAPRKVYLLRHAELLNPTGQNILLKLIEEGPAYASFLFCAPAPEMLLPTIRSRCETVRAMGEEQQTVSEDGKRLADLILNNAPEPERVTFLVTLEKKDREEIALILGDVLARLTQALPARPELLPVVDALEPIREACEFNISAGHLAGWIASVL